MPDFELPKPANPGKFLCFPPIFLKNYTCALVFPHKVSRDLVFGS